MTVQTAAVPQEAPDFDWNEIRAIGALLATQREPIAEWMAVQGFDPDEGYVLVLPSSMLHLVKSARPAYVWVSSFVLEPMFLMNPNAALQPGAPSYADWSARWFQ